MIWQPLPVGPFDLCFADPPWLYEGSATKDQAAGKHYQCHSLDVLATLDPLAVMSRPNVLLMWVTCPKLEEGIALLKRWGFHFRGVTFVWVKTNKAGKPIHGQGVRPSITKPTTEFVIAGSTHRTGRPMPLANESCPQVVLAPRPDPPPGFKSNHSAKPAIFYELVDGLYPGRRKLELFARTAREGWTGYGDQL